jgi:hypothetical protein
VRIEVEGWQILAARFARLSERLPQTLKKYCHREA